MVSWRHSKAHATVGTRARTLARASHARKALCASCHPLRRMASMCLSPSRAPAEYRVCDSPSDDPLSTCFLKPSNWELPDEGKWVCMFRSSDKLDADDSY